MTRNARRGEVSDSLTGIPGPEIAPDPHAPNTEVPA